jgi:hypothetical protein
MSISHVRWLGGLACAMALVSTDASAEEHPSRITVAASLGVGSFWSDESHLGAGPVLGIAVRVQPWARWGFEFDTRRYTYERRFASGVVFAGDGLEFTGGVTYYLRTSGARPFISGGLGILRSEHESRFSINAPLSPGGISHGRPASIGEQVFHSTGTDAGLRVAGGVDVPLGAHWSLRPEARSLWGAGSLLSPLDLGASLALHW